MSQVIKLKRSAVPSNVPTTAQLELGEIAINTYDGKMFIKKDDGFQSIVEIGATPTFIVDDFTAGIVTGKQIGRAHV